MDRLGSGRALLRKVVLGTQASGMLAVASLAFVAEEFYTVHPEPAGLCSEHAAHLDVDIDNMILHSSCATALQRGKFQVSILGFLYDR